MLPVLVSPLLSAKTGECPSSVSLDTCRRSWDRYLSDRLESSDLKDIVSLDFAIPRLDETYLSHDNDNRGTQAVADDPVRSPACLYHDQKAQEWHCDEMLGNLRRLAVL